jgi:hypothetical protein
MFDPDIVSARGEIVCLRVSKGFGKVYSTPRSGETQTQMRRASSICTILTSPPRGSETSTFDSFSTASAIGPRPLQGSIRISYQSIQSGVV